MLPKDELAPHNEPAPDHKALHKHAEAIEDVLEEGVPEGERSQAIVGLTMTNPTIGLKMTCGAGTRVFVGFQAFGRSLSQI